MKKNWRELTHHDLSLDGYVDRGTIAIFTRIFLLRPRPVLIPDFERIGFADLDYYPELSAFLVSKISDAKLDLTQLVSANPHTAYGSELYYSGNVFLSLAKGYCWHEASESGRLDFRNFLKEFPWTGDGAPSIRAPPRYAPSPSILVLTYDLRSVNKSSFSRTRDVVRACVSDLPLEARTDWV